MPTNPAELTEAGTAQAPHEEDRPVEPTGGEIPEGEGANAGHNNGHKGGVKITETSGDPIYPELVTRRIERPSGASETVEKAKARLGQLFSRLRYQGQNGRNNHHAGTEENVGDGERPGERIATIAEEAAHETLMFQHEFIQRTMDGLKSQDGWNTSIALVNVAFNVTEEKGTGMTSLRPEQVERDYRGFAEEQREKHQPILTITQDRRTKEYTIIAQLNNGDTAQERTVVVVRARGYHFDNATSRLVIDGQGLSAVISEEQYYQALHNDLPEDSKFLTDNFGEWVKGKRSLEQAHADYQRDHRETLQQHHERRDGAITRHEVRMQLPDDERSGHVAERLRVSLEEIARNYTEVRTAQTDHVDSIIQTIEERINAIRRRRGGQPVEDERPPAGRELPAATPENGGTGRPGAKRGTEAREELPPDVPTPEGARVPAADNGRERPATEERTRDGERPAAEERPQNGRRPTPERRPQPETRPEPEPEARPVTERRTNAGTPPEREGANPEASTTEPEQQSREQLMQRTLQELRSILTNNGNENIVFIGGAYGEAVKRVMEILHVSRNEAINYVNISEGQNLKAAFDRNRRHPDWTQEQVTAADDSISENIARKLRGVSNPRTVETILRRYREAVPNNPDFERIIERARNLAESEA